MNVFACKQGRDFTPSFTLSRVMHLWKKVKGIVLRGITGIFQQASFDRLDYHNVQLCLAQLVITSIIFIYLLKQPKSANYARVQIMLCYFCITKIVIYQTCNQFFWPAIRVTGKLKYRNHFFVCLLSHSWDLDPTGSDSGLFPQDSTHQHNKLGFLGQRPRVGCSFFEFLYLSHNELRTLKVFLV